MANKKKGKETVVHLNPYADPKTAMLNADWIKHARDDEGDDADIVVPVVRSGGKQYIDVIDPYADPELAEINADWIKYAGVEKKRKGNVPAARGKSGTNKIIHIDPYADPELAEINADWIKYVHGGKAQEEDLAAHDAISSQRGRTAVAKSFASIRDSLSILKGGKGSGNFEHAGRPGKVGGSAPRGEHTTAGITPYHETKPLSPEEVDKLGHELATELKKMATVSNVTYNGVGQGGWEGGAEPTLIISYDGNGEGIKLLAKYGKKWGQDGVLLRKATTPDDPQAQPSFNLRFNYALSEKARAAVEELVVDIAKDVYGEANIGWTWWRDGDHTVLDSQAVSQWGGDAEKHMAIFDRLKQELGDVAEGSVEYNAVGIMDSDEYGTDHGYSKVIDGADPFEK